MCYHVHYTVSFAIGIHYLYNVLVQSIVLTNLQYRRMLHHTIYHTFELLGKVNEVDHRGQVDGDVIQAIQDTYLAIIGICT